MFRRSLAAAALAALSFVALFAAPAAAEDAERAIDVAIGNGDKVTGTLSPADEVEAFRATIPAGARLNVTTKGRRPRGGGPAPVVSFRVIDPFLETIVEDVPTKGTGARVKRVLIETTGEHVIEVFGDGVTAGDYQLVVSWSSPRKLAVTGDPSDNDFFVTFGADAGARATFSVKRAKGSKAEEPAIAAVSETEGNFFESFEPPKFGAVSHRVPNVTLPVGGQYDLLVVGFGGNVVVTVSIKPPKLVKRSIVLTDAKLGVGGERRAFGQIVGPDGATIAIDDITLPIAGASIEIPSGSLTFPTAIIIATSADVTASSTTLPAGPAVYFGPEGLRFSEENPPLITLPFDPAFAGGDETRLVIRVRDAKGVVTELPLEAPYPLVDLALGLITFPVSHFSSYQAFVTKPPAGSGDLDGDGIPEVVLPAPNSRSGVGRVYVWRGQGVTGGVTAGADLILDGSGAADAFGRAILVADLNGDGIDDLAISGRNPHRVTIRYGGEDFLLGGTTNVTLTGDAGDSNFGISLAAADLGGTSALDLVVGDESSSRGVATGGAAFVFFGPLTANRTSGQADVTVTGLATGDLFGAAVAAANVTPPVTGPEDGRADLVIGADQIDTASGAGSVYVFRGPLTAGTLAADEADAVIGGVATGDAYGLPLTTIDRDGDGVAKLCVSATGFDPVLPSIGTVPDAGRVYSLTAAPSTGSADGNSVKIDGTTVSQGFGRSLCAGRVFGTAADLFVGVPASNSVAIVTAFQDSTYADLVRIEDPASGSAFGSGVAVLDVDGDGKLDLLVAAPLDATGGVDAGAVYVFLGRSQALTANIDTSDAALIFLGAPGERLGGGSD